MAKTNIETTTAVTNFPPVVAVLGHVDHGKTSLLDAIRKTSIADREHGGITQSIGASSVEIEHEGKKRQITFLDTPGHEAFSKMRSRGARVADIGLLIVSSVDGVMPQTKESISLLKAANIPFIVVLTKSDLDTKNPEKVKQQLLGEQIQLEGYGGDVPSLEVSSKSGMNVKELLDLILLVFDMRTESKSPGSSDSFEGIVIESRLDPKSGPKVSIVVKSGTLRVRDEIVSDDTNGKVRSIVDDKRAQLQEITIGQAAEILGFESVPEVGSSVVKKHEEQQQTAPQVEIEVGEPEDAPIYAPHARHEGISLILVADTKGSLEAIIQAIPDDVKLILQKTGDVTEADVLLAKSTGGIVLGFNTKLKPEIIKLALIEKVLVKNYQIIYEMLSEIADVVEGKKLSLMEQVLGKAKILASFPYEKDVVLGIKILDGRVAKGDKIRVERGDETVGEGRVTSLRQGKDQTSKVQAPLEAGIIISPSLDFQVGDVVICHS